ncbi:hypothetical protein ILUMI_13979 [Ignelater luminosus]|uniref:Uncharacterized protein n=1 Tax=Ignelater luminosus TaxID=2038154 RepID=A0A8K0CRA3_IGNLU|nr:hypothetical protein ILUMI_13979 [Ignelater luminosus]
MNLLVDIEEVAVFTYVLLLLTCTIGVLTEDTSTEAQERIDSFLKPPPSNSILHKPLSHLPPVQKEEPSFFSKVASWIYPFGSDEKSLEPLPAETQHRYAPQYLPAPPHPAPQIHQSYSKQPCNPCNKEPWIPVAGTHGHNTVIGFVQQSHLGNQGYLPPQSPPPNVYGPPSPNLQDLHPPPLSSHYGPPISNQYGAPSLPQNIHPQYGVPKDQYGFSTNVKPVFGLPPENYRSPLQYIAPPPPLKYHNPSKYRQIPLKNINLQQQKIGPPKQSALFYKQGIPKLNPSKFKLHAPPQHGPPIPLNFDKPSSDMPIFSRPPPVTNPPFLSPDFKLPSVSLNYVPHIPNQSSIQASHLKPPSISLNHSPNIPNQNSVPTPHYKPPSINLNHSPNIPNQNSVQTPHYNSPSINLNHLPNIPNQNYVHNSHYNPPSSNFNHSPNIPNQNSVHTPHYNPPAINLNHSPNIPNQNSVHTSHYNPPSSNLNHSPNIPNQGSVLSPPSINFNHASTIPSHSPTLDLPQFNVDYIPSLALNHQQFSNTHNVSPLPTKHESSPTPILPAANIEQNVLGNSGINYPILNYVTPNVNSNQHKVTYTDINFHQALPLQDTHYFHGGIGSSVLDNLPQHGSNIEIKANKGQSADDVQFIPSIRVAEYLASIEHPINVIQSPLVEVIATDNIQQAHESESSNSYGNNKVLLSENPVVVGSHDEDTHAAATAQNASYHNSLPHAVPNKEINHNKGVIPTYPTEIQSSSSNSFPSSFEAIINNIAREEFKLESSTPRSNNYSSVNYITHNGFSQSSVTPNKDTNSQKSYKNVESQPAFTQPPMDYSNWQPTFGTLSTSMVPPIAEPVWFTASAAAQQITSTTKKPKQVQIIIPYISSNHSSYLHTSTNLFKTTNIQNNKAQPNKPIEPSLITALPLFTQPPTVQEPVWSHYVTDHAQDGSNHVTATASTEKPKSSISNIRDLLIKEQQKNDSLKALPFDIIRLQKNIDDWTEQEFSNSILTIQKASTSGKLVPSKNIPSEYLTTQPYNKNLQEVTTVKPTNEAFYDHEAAGSNTKISTAENNKDVDTNLIITETTTFPTTTETLTTVPLETTTPIRTTNSIIANSTSTTENNINEILAALSDKLNLSIATPNPMWEKLQVSISPLTKEKVYVVTPQPWSIIPKEINDKLLAAAESLHFPLTSPKFSVVIQPEGAKRTKEVTNNGDGRPQLVYSEWPHLINNLITTTTEKPKVTNHPLLGLMDLSSYTPPANSTVETYGGHSRVITVVTPTSATKKKTTRFEEKKTTATTKIVPLYSTTVKEYSTTSNK